MTKLFPDHYFHIGETSEWKGLGRESEIQEFKKAHNYKSNDELQTYFRSARAEACKQAR